MGETPPSAWRDVLVQGADRTGEGPAWERRLEMRRVAQSVRDLISVLVGTTAPPEAFEGMAREIEALAQRLAAHPRATGYEAFADAVDPGDGSLHDPGDLFDNSPVQGLSNPLAPPVRLRIEGDQVVGQARFNPAYEGPPGHVHGGHVAAVCDELLGMTQSLTGTGGMTARLAVDYRSPTPLETDLTLVGWIEAVEGRKIFARGQIRDGDRLCVETEGLFLTMDLERFEAMKSQREERFGS